MTSPTVPRPALVAGILSLVLAMSCGPVSDPLEGEPLALDHSAGKQETVACGLSGAFRADGDWSSFSSWFFTLENGRLVHSSTDNLDPEEWPTSVSTDPFNPEFFSLVQITEASDAMLETVLHLRVQRSAGGGQSTISTRAAYTVVFDYTCGDEGFSGTGCDSVERNTVTITAL